MDGKGGQIQTNRLMEKTDRDKLMDGRDRQRHRDQWKRQTDKQMDGKDRQR
jgi:hypothetical protein